MSFPITTLNLSYFNIFTAKLILNEKTPNVLWDEFRKQINR